MKLDFWQKLTLFSVPVVLHFYVPLGVMVLLTIPAVLVTFFALIVDYEL